LPQEQEWKLPEKQELEEEESCGEVNGLHLHRRQEQTSYQERAEPLAGLHIPIVGAEA